MSKKKICFIAQFAPPMHGLSKAVETLYNSDLADEFEFEKVDITNNKNFLKNLIAIWKSKVDLFYFTISQTKSGNLRDLVILKLLNMKKKKCLIHLHGGYYRKLVDNEMYVWQRKMNYKAIRKLEGAIVLSESLRTIFKGMISNDKIFVVPNCVDDEFLMNDTEFEEMLKTADTRTVKHVLYLSNFIKTKGYPEVLEMAKLEKERCVAGGEKKFHFDFAGKFFAKSEEEYFFEYIKEYNLKDFITYHGIVGGEKKQKILRDCDIFVLLTRYPNEGQPISILEAMGNGMMIVTTDHAGIPDIVENGVNGIVIELGTKNTVRFINNKMINIRASLIQIGKVNRTKCVTNFSQQKYLSNMRIVFRKVNSYVKV